MASAKRCHYEVMGLPRDCSAEEIRSTYRKLALQRHPDKLVQSGLSQTEATAQFQELQHAYEVLSDPKERAWYDSHRSQILFSDPSSANSGPNSVIPDLFAFFSNTVYSGYSDSGKGFYKVYSDIFDKIYGNEINFAKKLGLGLDTVREAPVMGNLESPYTQVTAFYNYWLGFCTVMDFCWVDQYDAMSGPNRKSRRVMEEENKKLRKKAKKEFNETVRGLAEFVKKRDKRVIDMAVKRNEELENKRREERERKQRLERERMERFKAYEEPDWAKVEEEEEEEDNGFDEKKRNDGKELYCVVCGKKFKSEKQWKNHEQSKKHKEKVEELKRTQDIEDDEFEATVDEERVEVEEGIKELLDNGVDELGERFSENFGIREEKIEDQTEIDDREDHTEIDDEEDQTEIDVEEKELHGVHESNGIERDDEGIGLDNDDQIGVLEAMLTGRKNKKKATTMQPKPSSDKLHVEDDGDETSFMEYDNRKSTRRRRAKTNKGERNVEEDNKDGTDASNQQKENNEEDSSYMEESSYSLANNKSFDKEADDLERRNKASSKATDRIGATKNDTKAMSKISSKGKKSKVSGKNSGNLCETCRGEFESRNKLHQHLGETGHATLKHKLDTV